jgi:hypothetical protein
MEIQGRVVNGVVVLDSESPLPEGAIVTVVYPIVAAAVPIKSQSRISVPLVPSDRPGSVRLTGKRVAKLLDDDDVSA